MLHLSVACTSCGACIGHLFMAFREKRNKLVQDLKETEYGRYSFNDGEFNSKINLDPIFTELGIPTIKICCRAHLNTTVLPDSYFPTNL